MACPSSFHVVSSYMMVCVVVFCVFYGVNGVSTEEFLEMENYLKFINRPGVKTIQNEDGEILDCVDINKQPGLDHPALKNHKIYMEPTSLPDGITAQPSGYIAMKTGLVHGGCPDGTVPIRRVKLEQIVAAGSVSNLITNKYGRDVDKRDDFINRIADETMFGEAGGIYKGTEVTMNVWNPKVTSEQKFSRAELLLSNSPFYDNFIEAGWNVNPGLYGDNKTHLFVRWTADNYNNTGCYDLMCSGFIQVNRTVTPGMTLKKVSSYGGTQINITLLVFWDEGTESWWLGYRETVTGSFTWVGYWPGIIFTNLIRTADRIVWGGVAAGPFEDNPQMGSGHFPSEGYKKAAYMERIQYVDPDLVLRNVPTGLSTEENCSLGYKVKDEGEGSHGTGRFFFYGGPGGHCFPPASVGRYSKLGYTS